MAWTAWIVAGGGPEGQPFIETLAVAPLSLAAITAGVYPGLGWMARRPGSGSQVAGTVVYGALAVLVIGAIAANPNVIAWAIVGVLMVGILMGYRIYH